MAVKFGRLPAHPEATHPRLHLGRFLSPEVALPPVPTTIDYLSKVTSWPVYLNDQIGDCTCAAAGHMIEVWTAYGSGTAVQVSDQDVLKAYEAVGGYVPGDPNTDQGAVMQDVLNYWRKTGIGGHKILAFAQVDIHNPAQVAAALWLFGHVYVGLNVPQSAMDQFDAGQPWDAVSNDGGILGGHAVDLGHVDPGTPGLQLVTWGRVQGMTWAFWSRYVEEAWVVLDEEWINAQGAAPEGLDTAALNAAFQELTGQPGPFPVNPTPTPTPTPVPTPPPAPTPPPGPEPVVAFLKELGHDLRVIADKISKFVHGR